MGDLPALEDRAVQRGRCDQPTEPHAGGDGLAGGAEVGDDLAVEGGERGHRCDVVAELRVVVVLDHDRTRAPRGGQQGQPIGAGHHRAERMLVGRRDVRRRAPAQLGHRLRGREVTNVPADGPDRFDGRPVAGVLVRHLAGRQGGQHLGEPAYRARRDQDLVGLTGQAAGAGEVPGKLDAEVRQSGGVVVRRGRGRHRDVTPGPAPGRAVPGVDPRRAGVEPDQSRCVGSRPRRRGDVVAVLRRPRRTSPSRAGSRASPRR